MEIDEFRSQVINGLNSLSYIDEIELYEIEENSFKGTAIVKRHYVLRVRFKFLAGVLTLSFTLLFENNRIWGLDKDNRIGWHIHPLNNTSTHEPIEEMAVGEIISILDSVCLLL